MKKRTDNFDKFFKVKKGAAVKEAKIQERKKAKKERAAAIEKHFEEKRRIKEELKLLREKNKNIQLNIPTQKAPVITRKISEQELMPLNKFVAHCGICGRREAVEMIKLGKVLVNNIAITEPGHKVSMNDTIKIDGKKLFIQKNLVYILLNKPKDFITTTNDPQGRKTVLDIVKAATKERVYPVGRLDRNTTGVLIITNDGEMAQKLSHPSTQVKKIYEAKLDKPFTKTHFDKLLSGIILEDGFIKPDSLAYADSKDKSIIGIEIHSGKNRIVRRMFEHLGYDVKNLDRVMFANLTKKNVDRGKWRYLNEKEIRLLKYMNQSFIKKPKD